MPTPTIPAGNLFMDILLWTGASTSSGRTFTGLQFQPDFIWAKSRSGTYNHQLYDSNRGTGKRIASNTTDAETTNPINGYVSAFNSNGFTTIAGSTDNSWFNETNTTYVGWQWKAGGTAVTNTSGTISAQVSVNTTSGFSIVTYTSTTGTVGHGLGVAPAMIIMKGRNVSDQWTVGHSSLNGGSSPWNYGIPLNTSAATQTNSGFWNNTAPTSSVFSQGSWDSGYNKVAYCWAEIAGFSQFGSYTGNGSADGPFVFTNFRPRFVMIKSTGVEDWIIHDTARNPYNASNLVLYPNASYAEDNNPTYRLIDMVSNGFKMRSNQGQENGNGTSYIYMAFAENPFKYSLAR